MSVNGTGCDIMGQICEISDGLYLSGARAIKISKLRELGITCIFNVTIELPNLPIDNVEYVKISIDDSPFANLGYYFDRVADKIEEVRRRGGKSLVHCVAGVSRSASLCIAYLIKYKRMSLRKAYQHVKSRRHIIRPNPGFFRQLVEFEGRVLGSNSVTMVWNAAAGGHIPDLYEPEYNNTMSFLTKYGHGHHPERSPASYSHRR
jgi:protein-tyrosine phosphatase